MTGLRSDQAGGRAGAAHVVLAPAGLSRSTGLAAAISLPAVRHWSSEAPRPQSRPWTLEGSPAPRSYLWGAGSDRVRHSSGWSPGLSTQPIAAMIERHWEGIAAYCQPENKVALGFVEGLNNKIRSIQQRAFGYRDEEYFRLKILTCMLPKL